MIALIRHALEGFAIGIAQIIPGVSGGTMALIFGIYRTLIAAVSDGVGSLLRLVRGDFGAFLEVMRGLPWMLLGPLGVGVLVAVLTSAGPIEYLLSGYPEQMRGLFFGLIAGSLTIPWFHAKTHGVRAVVLALTAGVLAFILSGMPSTGISDPGLMVVFVSGALAISAMILPGVSGSYLLLVLGMYRPVLVALKDFDLSFLAVFGLGCVVGLGGFALLLNRLLRVRHDETMAVLVGLMAGSLRALWPWQDLDRRLLAPEAMGWESVVGMALIGLIISVALTILDKRQRNADA